MLSALIVDDEEWARLSIVSKLKKCRFKFQNIFQAQDAEQALQIACESHPDIVLCDIHMGGMNGLVFSSKLLAIYQDIKVVIISGYDDFSYAQEAIRLGVIDYLLKPIDNDGLNRAVGKCVRHIEQDRINNSALLALEKSKQWKKIRSLVAGIQTQTKLNYSQLFSAYTGECFFQTYCLYLDISCSLSLEILDDHITNLFPDLIFGENIIYYENKYNEFVIVVLFLNQERIIAPDVFVQLLETSLCKEVDYLTPYQYTFGISSLNYDMNKSIHEAVFCMKHRILCTNKTKIYPKDIAVYTVNKMDFTFLSDLGDCISRKDQEHLENVCKIMYQYLENSFLSYESMQNLYLRILILLGDHSVINPPLSLQMPNEIYNFSSVWDMIDFLKELLVNFFENTDKFSREDNFRAQLVREIQEYVQENFLKKISLREIARQKHVNYCYLSILFKEVTEVSFSEYLINIRLKHACLLLSNNRYKIKDVAELSGFSDQYYFSKCFKKVLGCTPSEYMHNTISE